MDLCHTFRIPHSHFLGGPLEWSDLDRAKAMSYRAFLAEKCPGCGTRQAEWDPEKGGNRDAYAADFDFCEGCSRLAELREQFDDATKKRGPRVFLTDPANVKD